MPLRIRPKPGKLIGILCVGFALSAGASTASAATDVSLTFSNAIDNQYQARAILADHGMLGSFYVNSGRIGNAGRLTWKQVTELAQDGNEIGGQTVDNFNLVGMTPADLHHQVCDDRTELLERGYSPTSFSYPTTASQFDAAAQAKVEQCGYSSGRGDTGLGNVGQPDGESIPPANPRQVRTRGTIDDGDSLATIQSWITEAEAEGAGGHNWFPIAFNNICDGPVPASCPTSRITTADLDALLDWLELREASGTQVKTVREVMTGTQQPEPPPVPGTVVSLTFDDGNDNQVNAQPILESHGMDGTFYIITGRVGTPTYMTWSQIDSIETDGNEIGGHTVNHPHLPTLTPAQQQAEICGARNTLIARYGEDNNFAYPFGEHDAVSEAKAEECGYSSARGVAGIGGTGEPKAETIPPADQWVVRTRGSVDINDTLPEVMDWIMDAEQIGNGWLNLVFHDICTPGTDTNCTDSRMSTADFDALLDWLEPREASMGTEVRTMDEVINESPPPPDVDMENPVTQIACDGAPCTSNFYDGAQVTLSASDTGGSGVDEIRYTLDGSLPTGSSPVYSGPIQVNSTTTIRYRATDNQGNAEAPKTQTVNIDLVQPAPPPVVAPDCSSIKKKLKKAKTKKAKRKLQKRLKSCRKG